MIPLLSNKTRLHTYATTLGKSCSETRTFHREYSAAENRFLFRRWFCHVDDDTYVNVKSLVALLREYDHKGDWYLGKTSISRPLEINDPDNPMVRPLLLIHFRDVNRSRVA